VNAIQLYQVKAGLLRNKNKSEIRNVINRIFEGALETIKSLIGDGLISNRYKYPEIRPI
jgi:hypothetical protein